MDREDFIRSLHRRVARSLMRAIDWCIPAHLQRMDSESFRHARIVTALNLALVVLSFSYVPVYLWLGTTTCALVLTTGSVFGAFSLVVMRVTGRARLVGNLVLGLYLATVTVQSCFQGGATGPKFLWFLPIPLLSILVCGRRWAVVWATSTVLVMATFIGLHLAGYRFRNEIRDIQETIYCLHLVGLSIGMYMVGAFHEALRNAILDRLRLAKDAAEVAAQAKTNFLANMSHEIRTPMTAILGFTENLLDPEVSQAERQLSAQTILRNGRHLLQILNDILDLSKLDAGRLVVECVQCRLADLLAEIHQLMRRLSETKGLACHVALDGPIPETVRTDPTRLRQILINLIGNAVKFTRSGEVRLVVREHQVGGTKPFIEFDVIDTGIGVPLDQHERLFRPFEQADSSHTREFGGTGLGLAISRQLARGLGGDVVLVGTSETGSTFRARVLAESPEGRIFELDQGRDAELPANRKACRVDEGPAGILAGIHVLLAEDGPDNQRLLTCVLRKAGAEVTLVQNGKEAVDAVLHAHDGACEFSLVLMDMQMPVMDGYAAARNLREAGCDLPIVALTAHAMAGDREKCLAAGCTDFVTKPINRGTLVEVIQRSLSVARDTAATDHPVFA